MQLLDDGVECGGQCRGIRSAALRDVVTPAAASAEHSGGALRERSRLRTRCAGGVVGGDDDDRTAVHDGAECDDRGVGAEAVTDAEHQLAQIVGRGQLTERLRGDVERVDPARRVGDRGNLSRALLDSN